MKPLSVEKQVDKILCIFASDISEKDNDKDYVYFKANKKIQDLIRHQTKLARIGEMERTANRSVNLNIRDYVKYVDERIKQLRGEIEC